MDEQLAKSVADGLVKVTDPPDDCYRPVWAVTFGVGASTYCLTYDQKKVADSVAEALRMLAITAISRYNGASPETEPGKKGMPPTPLDGPMPDLFAGQLEAMSKILGRVSEMLGREAHRLMDLRRAAANLAAEAADGAQDMPPGSVRDHLLLSVGAVREALSVFNEE